MGAIENGMVVGADVINQLSQQIGEQVDDLAAEHLADMLADAGSVEEAIQDQSDLIREAVERLRKHGDAKVFLAGFDSLIQSYLSRIARRAAERDVFTGGRFE